MNPKNLAGLSETERAYFESGGTVDPETGKPAEETNDAGTDQPNTPDNPTGSGETEQADPATQEATEQSDDADEEVVDVANADGETRRKMIAFGAYEKQRKQSKALKAELEKLQQQMAYMSGLMQRGQAPQAPQGQPQGQPQATTAAPDPQKEPEKWLSWVNQTLAKVHQSEQQQQHISVQQQQLDALNSAAYQAEQDFVSDHPDYYDALKHLDKERRDELKDAGYDAQTIQQIIEAQNRDIAIRALNNQGNPAEKFYNLAKRRGFKAPKPQPTETEAQRITRQAQNQKTNKSIASLAGSGTGELSIEALANMAPHEFNKMFKEGKVHEILGMPQ